MITTAQAEAIVLSKALHFGSDLVSFEEAIGQLLAEPLTADRDFPPFDRVTMDGIAIAYTAYSQGRRTFPLAGLAPAGVPQQHLADPTACIEVMTGAMLPAGTDTVIRYEDLERHNGLMTLHPDAVVKEGQNIHRQGSDRKRGDVLLQPGHRLMAPEMALVATVGKEQIRVSAPPHAVIFGTGNELVPPSETPLPHQIRASNVYQIQITLAQHGISAPIHLLPDDKEAMKEKLSRYIPRTHLVVLSGGVSAGLFDYLPEVLADLDMLPLVHKVAQRPGKPFLFAAPKTFTGSRVFALPGNPVSTFMCLHRYVLPYVRASMGLPPTPFPPAVLAEDITFKPDLTFFAQVRLSHDAQGRLLAHPIPGNGSGDMTSLAFSDAFMELPQGRDHFAAGEVYPVIRFRSGM